MEPVSAILITINQPAFAERSEEWKKGHAEDREVVAVDGRKHLHPAALQAEYADAVTDLRPLGIEIGFDEPVGKRPHVKRCRVGMRPFDLAAAGEGYCARERHLLSGKAT